MRRTTALFCSDIGGSFSRGSLVAKGGQGQREVEDTEDKTLALMSEPRPAGSSLASPRYEAASFTFNSKPFAALRKPLP